MSTEQLLGMSAAELADANTQLLRQQQRSSAALSSQVMNLVLSCISVLEMYFDSRLLLSFIIVHSFFHTHFPSFMHFFLTYYPPPFLRLFIPPCILPRIHFHTDSFMILFSFLLSHSFMLSSLLFFINPYPRRLRACQKH
jgi:hypothetical protein